MTAKYYICKTGWVKYIKIEKGVPYAWTNEPAEDWWNNSRWQPIHHQVGQGDIIGVGYGEPDYQNSLCHCNHKECVETDTEYHGPDKCSACGIDLVCPKCGNPYCINNEHQEPSSVKDIKHLLGEKMDKLAVLVLIGGER